MHARKIARSASIPLAALALMVSTGCVSVAEFRKLESKVQRMERGGGSAEGGSRERLADLGAKLTAVESQDAELRGRVEVTERRL